MPVQEVDGLQTQEGSFEELAELLAGAIGTGAELRLFKSTFNPVIGSKEADFEAAEADFVGYAPVAITWGDAVRFALGQIAAPSQNVVFTATADTTPNTLGGAWIHVADVGPPAVDVALIAFRFPVPVTIAAAGDSVGVKAFLAAPDTNSFANVET